MLLLHDLSEQTKRLLDYLALVLAGVSAAVTSVSLMQALSIVALIVSIIAGTLSAAWTVTRFHDRKKGLRYSSPSSSE